ncbi:MAG: hypothetical protein OHK0039_44320 [Bacteroidia bacterium]
MTTPGICLLTGPIRSGKTSTLMRWAATRDDLAGFLTPDDATGRRCLLTLHDRQWHPFELDPQDRLSQAVCVGRFRFSAAAFARADLCLRSACDGPARWIVVDEIGKLELDGQGLAPTFTALLAAFRTGPCPARLLLVVRDSLLTAVQQHFDLADAQVCTTWPAGAV